MLSTVNPTTPTVLSQDLAALVEQLVPGGKAGTFTRSAPPEARPVDCFETVERRIVEKGGTACYGWLLWECQRLYLEAEFYALWRDSKGDLHDITPRVGPGHVLFLADPQRVFEGRRVPSVRRPLTQDPAVTGFLRACEEEFELINRGARAFARNVALQGTELGELQLIWQRKIAYSQRLALLGTSEA
jgi:hypothetical protein